MQQLRSRTTLAVLAFVTGSLSASCGGGAGLSPNPQNLGGDSTRGPLAPVTSSLLHVPNTGSNGFNTSITAYPLGANGNVTPTNTIAGPSTQLSQPIAIAFDSKSNAYVTNLPPGACVQCVTVFAPGATGNAAPSDTICGPATGLDSPFGIAIDAADNIYVVNSGNDSVTIYKAGAKGNVSPASTIRGPRTGLRFPDGIAVDANGKIYVSNSTSPGGTIQVYAAGASGDVAPIATIGGDRTGLSEASGIAIDSVGNVYVANSNGGSGGNGSVTVYAAGENGNVAPTAVITGPDTQVNLPSGVAVDSMSSIYVTTSQGVVVFQRGANGDMLPIRSIAGSNTGLVGPGFPAIH